MVKSRSVKRCIKICEKREGAGAATPPFPSRARLIFVLLVLIRPDYTILEPGYVLAGSDYVFESQSRHHLFG